MARFLFHKVEAPEGKQFADDVEPTGDGWVDTPAKFDPNYVEPPKADLLVVPGGFIHTGPSFPAHFYNRAGELKEVANAEQFEALNPDVWKDSPAAFGPVEDTPVVEEPPYVLTAEQVADVYASTVVTLKAALADVTSKAKLAAIESAEAVNPQGPRQGVFKALNARRAELTQ